MSLTTALVVVGLSGSAHALSLPKISVTRAADAADCPGAGALSAATDALILHAGPVPRDDMGAQSFEVSFTRDARGYVGTIDSTGAHSGVRVLSDPGPTCAALAEAIPLTLALIFDEANPDRPRPVPAPPAALAPAPAPPLAPVAAPKPVVGEPSFDSKVAYPRFVFDAGGGVAMGIVRAVAPIALVSGAWNLSRFFSIGVGALAIPTQRLPLGPGSVHVSLLAAGPRGCVRVFGEASALHLGACLHAALGSLSASTTGYLQNDAANRAWLALLASLDLGGPILGGSSRFEAGWFVRAAGVAPSHRHSFGVRDVGVAYETPSAAFVGGAGLTLSIK